MNKETNLKLEENLWEALSSDRMVMRRLDGVENGFSRPMTAMVEGDGGPIWFFTSRFNAMIGHLSRSQRAIAAFSAKGHDLFATIRGDLTAVHDRQVIKRLWNPLIAALYHGADDPKLALLRFDPERAEVWLDGSCALAGASTNDVRGGSERKAQRGVLRESGRRQLPGAPVASHLFARRLFPAQRNGNALGNAKDASAPATDSGKNAGMQESRTSMLYETTDAQALS